MINVLHLGAYARIKKGGEFLLIKKSRGPYIGKYDLPGGKIEHGESPEQALKRELVEETGLEAKELKLFRNLSVKVDFKDERGDVSMHQIGLIYDVEVKDSKLVNDMEFEDSLGAEWVNIDSLKSDDLSPFALTITKHE